MQSLGSFLAWIHGVLDGFSSRLDIFYGMLGTYQAGTSLAERELRYPSGKPVQM